MCFRVRDDPHEDALWEALWSDVEKGRMRPPVCTDSLDWDKVVLTPRFAVPQPSKIRPVDDATASGINSRTCCHERMAHDTIDMLSELAGEVVRERGRLPHFWKARCLQQSCAKPLQRRATCAQADVDSAFRRVPLEEQAWEQAYVVFKRHGVTMASQHLAVFFGALSSVHNWARVAALLAGILRCRPAWRNKLGCVDAR